MRVEKKKPTDPDIINSAKAMRRAAKRALELGRESGTPVYVMEDGKIIDLNKDRRKRPKRK